MCWLMFQRAGWARFPCCRDGKDGQVTPLPNEDGAEPVVVIRVVANEDLDSGTRWSSMEVALRRSVQVFGANCRSRG